MNSEKILLLACMAVATITLSGPAGASAAVWLHEGVPLEQKAVLGLSGGEIFQIGEADGMSCAAQAELLTEGGNTGKITAFEISKEGCFGFGKFGECELVRAPALGLPWLVHVNATDLTITGGKIRRIFNAGCPIGEVLSTVGSLTTALSEPTEIAVLEFFGEGIAHISPGSTTGYTTFGSFEVEGENAGTYGIG